MAVQFVAHRGESEAAPENTLESFTLAWARGARLIEGDFHLTLDGEVVCMHDSNAGRTCGVKRELAELTLAEIKALDAGAWKGPQWRFTRVPTLAEVLGTMPDYGEIYIEFKSVGPIVDRLREIFAASGRRPEQLTFIAFDETTIATVKRLFPAHRAYWLTCNERRIADFSTRQTNWRPNSAPSASTESTCWRGRRHRSTSKRSTRPDSPFTSGQSISRSGRKP